MSGRGSEEQIQGPDRVATTPTSPAWQAPWHRHQGHQGRGQARPRPGGGARAAPGSREREVQGGGQGGAVQEPAGKKTNR